MYLRGIPFVAAKKEMRLVCKLCPSWHFSVTFLSRCIVFAATVSVPAPTKLYNVGQEVDVKCGVNLF